MNTLITKTEFDNIIKNNVKNKQFGYETSTGKYDTYFSNDEFEKFVIEMKESYPGAYTGYSKGKGGELESHKRKDKEIPPKMACVASSSRFCYLAFRNSEVIHKFEHECRINGIKGNAPQLDIYFSETANYAEVKCHEIFDKHIIEMKDKYRERITSTENGFALTDYRVKKVMVPETDQDEVFEISLKEFGLNKETSMFDIKQLLCHLMGIADSGDEEPTLLYLFFKPKCDEEDDRNAVDEVFDELKNEITAIFNSYPIQHFCRKHGITLQACAEYSEEMTELTPENRIVLY